ncbi:amidase [Williamsia sp. CHRR-6]|uniref:amidase n=1 Tax=Williamsia sp. CHRR-6 TaxID=2835871 RepID=UPI001BDA6400|nr:amidase family protein [Williamsia sp. CHRR-6]MBT0567165.1 amidase [Williamsia sp. CHRR-6]
MTQPHARPATSVSGTADDSWIGDASAFELGSAIGDGRVSSRRVVEFHIDILRARSDFGAMARDRFDVALAEADAVDAGPKSADRPLLGVPCTIKESIPVAGMPHTAGLSSRIGVIADSDALAVQRLRDAGAIIVGVTNTAELCLGIESTNRVYGRTSNPYDKNRVSGGSSGGEGCAIGAGGIPFGLGGDTGGSIRIPSFYCGVFGHKPSPGLVPANESIPSLARGDEVDLLETLGPMARRGSDLMPLLQVLAADPDGRRCGTVESVALEGLRVVIPTKSSYLRPMDRSVRDARDAAGRALADRGADVVWQPLPAMRTVIASYLMELRRHAGTSVMSLFDSFGDRPRHRTPALLRANSVQLQLAMIGDRLPELLPGPARSLIDRYARELAEEVAAAIGEGGVMLHPPPPQPAPLHNRTLARPWLFGGAAVFNMLGMAVTQVPIGFSPRNLPVGVQVASQPGNDHVTIAVALELEKAFGGWVPPHAVAARQ